MTITWLSSTQYTQAVTIAPPSFGVLTWLRRHDFDQLYELYECLPELDTNGRVRRAARPLEDPCQTLQSGSKCRLPQLSKPRTDGLTIVDQRLQQFPTILRRKHRTITIENGISQDLLGRGFVAMLEKCQHYP